MKGLTLISFDVGGTLVDHRFMDLVWNTGIPRLYAEKRGITLQEAREQVTEEYNNIGKNDMRWYILQYWFDHFGLNGSPTDLLESFRHEVRVYPEVPSVLDNLGKTYKIVVFSNAPKDILNYEIEGLRTHFVKVFSSTTDFTSFRKTAKMYTKICNILETEPRQALHVGDNEYDDYLAPRKAGMQAFYLDRSRRNLKDLTLTDLRGLEELLVDA
ncbi:HAD family hydrolase [Candidatus Bathyarchaeota archaeon]|nr:HAD family hydrolase [Candidatus Bathyarchaeota archaeon]